MDLQFSAIDDHHGENWGPQFARLWPAYRQWYLREGLENRPTFLEARMALRQHMPEMLPIWEQCVAAAGGGDLAARFLSLFCPPAYLTGCSQAVWPGDPPLLVRNYDYHPGAFDALALRTQWGAHAVLGTSDCMIGLVDGINDAGLALSLTFGGRRVVGTGFGLPIILLPLAGQPMAAEPACVSTRSTPHPLSHAGNLIVFLLRPGNMALCGQPQRAGRSAAPHTSHKRSEPATATGPRCVVTAA